MAEASSPAMTVRDVAAYLNVNEKTVYRLAQRGELPGFKVAGAWRFQQVDLDDLVQLMIRHPDVVVITDTKDDLGEILGRFVSRAVDADDSTVARIVPQVYSFADYETAMGVHPFREVIFSLYKLRISFDEVAEFVASRGNLTVVTLPVGWFRPAVVERLGDDGPHVFVHTVNRPDAVRELLDAGVHGFYTDVTFQDHGPPSIHNHGPRGPRPIRIFSSCGVRVQ